MRSWRLRVAPAVGVLLCVALIVVGLVTDRPPVVVAAAVILAVALVGIVVLVVRGGRPLGE